MSDENKKVSDSDNAKNTEDVKVANNDSASKAVAANTTEAVVKEKKPEFGRYNGQKKMRKGKKRFDGPQDEFDQRIVDVARVTRVMAGGKRMRFRACVAIGNKRGKVAIGLAKGADVTIAVSKAVAKAKKEVIVVPIVNDTIPHEVYCKTGAAKILFKPARKGTGVIAGGAVRIVLELSGIKNISSKILGTNNKINNVRCVIEALKSLKKAPSKKEKEEMIENKKENNIDNSK